MNGSAEHHACDVAFEDLTRKLAELDALLAAIRVVRDVNAQHSIVCKISNCGEKQCVAWREVDRLLSKMKPSGTTESLRAENPVPSTESTRGSSNEDTGSSRAGDAGSTPDPRATESSPGPGTGGAPGLLARVRACLALHMDCFAVLSDLDAWTERARNQLFNGVQERDYQVLQDLLGDRP